MTSMSLEEFKNHDPSFKKMLSSQAQDLANLGFIVIAIIIEPTNRTPFKWGWSGCGETIETMHKILLLTNRGEGNPKAAFTMRHKIQDRHSDDPRDQHFVGPEEYAECWPTSIDLADLIKIREKARREARSLEIAKERQCNSTS